MDGLGPVKFKKAVLVLALVNVQTALPLSVCADAAALPIDDSNSSVIMTEYRLNEGPGGQSYFFTNEKQRMSLPGAGCAGAVVCVYKAPNGQQWYIDKTGTQQTLSAVHSCPRAETTCPGLSAAKSSVYGDPGYNESFEYYEPRHASVAANQFNTTSSGMPQCEFASPGAHLTETNSSTGVSAVPWGTTIYWGEGHPWYYNAVGAPVYVSTSQLTELAEWRRQNNYWQSSSQLKHLNNHYYNYAKHQFNQKNWNTNDWKNHWGKNNWPGKEHGLPPPADQYHGRLYWSKEGVG